MGSVAILTCAFRFLAVEMLSLSTDYILVSEWFGLDEMSLLIVVICPLVSIVSLNRRFKDLKITKKLEETESRGVSGIVILIALGRMVFFCVSR